MKKSPLLRHVPDAPPGYPAEWHTWLYDCDVTMVFTPPSAGWTYWILAGSPQDEIVCIHCSEVFDPLANIVAWFEQIAANRLPVELTVDEEGCLAVLRASPIAGRPGWLEFAIERRSYPDSTESWQKRIFLCRARRRQMVREFYRRFALWLREDYRPSGWGGARLQFNLSRLHRFAQPSRRNRRHRNNT